MRWIGYFEPMLSRVLQSVLALCPVLLLVMATGETPSLPPTDAKPVPAPTGSQTAPLQDLQGRQLWMVNAPETDCRRAESLGLTVTCEPERPGAAGPEIVAWCPEISQAAAEALVAALGLQGVVVRTWQQQPADKNADECGQFYEITLRY